MAHGQGDWEELERRGAERELNADEILRLLVGAGVDFVVIGGFAVIAHGQYIEGVEVVETFTELRAEALEADVPEVGVVRFASFEHLQLMKRAAGRPQDLNDLAQLDEIRRG